MNTIEAYEQEIRFQISDLPRFVRESQIEKLNVKDQERCALTGTGDSFAAAMIAEFASNNKVRCLDPMNICTNPSTIKDKLLYALSISGNTKANIEAVKSASKHAARTIAITANRESRLARVCNKVIELKFKNVGMLTAASISFTTSMLACLSLVRNVTITDAERLFNSAESDAEEMKLNGHVYVLGNWITYPLAIYGCAKMYEVLGMKAQHVMLEQFCHMQLFSVREGDSILILSNDDKARELSAKLVNSGYNSHVFEPKGKTLEDNLLYYSFLLQLIVLNNAKRLQLKECYFMTNDKLREISSSLIY
ncbi:MAG: SIS domain-containing protein [Nitrososphaerales archaeon]